MIFAAEQVRSAAPADLQPVQVDGGGLSCVIPGDRLSGSNRIRCPQAALN
jgi:hypothetical protein